MSSPKFLRIVKLIVQITRITSIDKRIAEYHIPPRCVVSMIALSANSCKGVFENFNNNLPPAFYLKLIVMIRIYDIHKFVFYFSKCF